MHGGGVTPEWPGSPRPEALVVDPNEEQAFFAARVLSAGGFRVTVVGSYHDARRLLARLRPCLILTAVRLEEYNGLHLLLRQALTGPPMHMMITSPLADAVLQAEAERIGATFVVLPTTDAELAAAAARTLARATGNSTADPIRPPFERRIAERRRAPATDAQQIERRTSDRRKASLMALT